MDDLTTRALRNQNNANTAYNQQQQREEQQKVLTEAPTFITGFADGKYQVQRLGQDPVATGVPVTNGLLQNGQRVTTTGQYVDGVPRVKPSVPAVPVVKLGGKIKYLYSMLNDNDSKDLWLGGWQPKPIKIKAIDPGDQQFTLKNPGSNRFWLDYGKDVSVADGYYYTLTEAGLIYEHHSTDSPNTGFDTLSLNPHGYSFWSRGAYGSSGGGTGSFWGRLFQNDFIGGVNGDIAFKHYLTPTLVSPETFISYNPAYLPYAITADGSKGVGGKTDSTNNPSTTTLITYDSAIFDTGVDGSSMPYGYFDCFDDKFTIIDATTIAANALTQSTFTAQVYTYDYAGSQQRVSKVKVYGIPAAQRTRATLIGQPSYHP
ncbi:MAG: hypothetical protein KME27_10540 [Lyngbya sp. HA4199-MV5]|jgi:hypothetical protein|nr:hypothetical protein [Lyngbya sp. HA4199-MV5]